jgi:glycerol-3-phosphate acyltransferase PlsY
MSAPLAAALLIGAYLLGSISFSIVVVRLLRGTDVRSVGSGNAGATNTMRAAGKGAGVAVLLLDLGKGAAAVVVPRSLDAPPSVVGAAAVAVVLGHLFPVFFGFRGGKGVATSAGALGALAPAAMALGLLVFVAVVHWKRYVSLGSVVTAALFPLLAWFGHRRGWIDYGGGWLLLASATIALLILIKHSSNLQRIRQGTEPRLGGRTAQAEEVGG